MQLFLPLERSCTILQNVRVLENVNFLTLKTECTSINTSIMCDNMRILISSELILDTEFLYYTEHDNIKNSYCV